MSTHLWFPLLLAAVLAGCAQSSKQARVDAKTVNWSERIGRYTWDQAMADLGKPAVIGESAAGRSAEWVLRRSPRVSFGFGVGGGSYGSSGGVGVGVGTSVSPPPSGEYLRLEFGPDGQLSKWSRIKY
jgi:hypothetical protein